jgi:hypothetical protein
MLLRRKWNRSNRLKEALCLGLLLSPLAYGADVADEVRTLREQNEKLQQELSRQKTVIEDLQKSVRQLGDQRKNEEPVDTGPKGLLSKPFSSSNIILGGEAGVVFFDQGKKGAFPNSEFRIDEARLFLDVKLWEDVYFYTELNIIERESADEYMYVGELYVDFENLFPRAGERLLNFRAGRFYIPFGEEYLERHAVDNPLISHSVSDLWGVDEGVEVYGQIEKWRYVAAIQNGGNPSLRDYDSDKSFAARISYLPTSWLAVSASGMRTGDINSSKDKFSAMWFGNGFFEALSASAPTFNADLFEGDIKLSLNSRAYLKGAGGYIHYSDKSPTGNDRDMYYYFTEGLYNFTEKFYGAARFSQIFADEGFPLVGGGDFVYHMFGPTFGGPTLSSELWRLSLGLGYRWNRNVITKMEYSFNGGQELNGTDRDQENLFGAEIAVRF